MRRDYSVRHVGTSEVDRRVLVVLTLPYCAERRKGQTIKLSHVFTWLIAVSLVATACGGEDDVADGVASLSDQAMTTTVVAASAISSDEQALLAFTRCMRDEGVDLADPTVDADGNVGFSPSALASLRDIDQDAARAAFEECADHLEGVSLGFELLQDAQFQDDLVAFSQCMRDNGFDLPDPDFGSIAEPGGLYGDQVDPNDPDFEAAFEACEEVLPGFNIGTPADG